jgi:predicted deacylase
VSEDGELRPYPSPSERDQELRSLVRALGGSLVDYGHSVDGEPLVAAVLPCVDGPAPRILCSANIHGPEYVAGRVAMGSLAALGPTGPGASLRRRAEVWVIPCLNPDGYRRTWDSAGSGPLSGLRTNANGVDLNRNFPLPSGRPSRLPGAGSSRRGSATYRGPRALSEPETRSLDQVFEDRSFHASANLHSFMGTCIPARTTVREHFAEYGRLCRAFAAAQPWRRYRRLSSRWFDVFTGEQEDHQHHAHGTWAVCIETFDWMSSWRQHARAPSTFWRFNPRDPTPWVDNDVPGIIAYFHAALSVPRPR